MSIPSVSGFAFGSIQRATVRLLRDESGQATIFMALFMGILFLGFAALAIDVGMLYRERRIVQTAADAGALAAAVTARSFVGRIGVNLNGSGN